MSTFANNRLLVYASLLTVGGVAAVSLFGTPKIKSGQKLFLLGDSLAVGLSTPLAQIAKDHKVTFKSMAAAGTRIDQWASNAALYQELQTFQPDLILVSLGTNDEYLRLDAHAQQAPHLKKLLSQLRSKAPVVWIGPPKLPATGGYAWAGTNGSIPLIRENVPSSHYFPSHTLDLPRSPDQLHPSVRGSAGWAGKIWEFIT
jgi:lysophospholipase L1-like esterase